jgi:hypothetical protein
VVHCATLGADERGICIAVFFFAAPEASSLLHIFSYLLGCRLGLYVSPTDCIYDYETDNKAGYA